MSINETLKICDTKAKWSESQMSLFISAHETRFVAFEKFIN